MICCLIGNSKLGLSKSMSKKPNDLKGLTRVILENLIIRGNKTFLTGLEPGFDRLCVNTLLKLKKVNKKIRLIAILPHQHFYIYDRQAQFILKNCDDIIEISEKYRENCVDERNRFMIEKCDIVLAWFEKKDMHLNTLINYARQLKKDVKLIDEH